MTRKKCFLGSFEIENVLNWRPLKLVENKKGWFENAIRDGVWEWWAAVWTDCDILKGLSRKYLLTYLPWKEKYHCTADLLLFICIQLLCLWTLLSVRRPLYHLLFYCSAARVTSQVLQLKTVNKRYRGRNTFSSVHCFELALLVWSNPNKSNRRSAIPWYFPLQSESVFSGS